MTDCHADEKINLHIHIHPLCSECSEPCVCFCVCVCVCVRVCGGCTEALACCFTSEQPQIKTDPWILSVKVISVNLRLQLRFLNYQGIIRATQHKCLCFRCLHFTVRFFLMRPMEGLIIKWLNTALTFDNSSVLWHLRKRYYYYWYWDTAPLD